MINKHKKPFRISPSGGGLYSSDSGFIILDKPIGMTSMQAVSKVKRIFGSKKAGHAGTLDPLTSGVLPIALGEATKVLSYMQSGLKTYHFTVSWGQERSTDDCEGEVTQTSIKRPTFFEVEEVIKQYSGSILQVPPQFSAIKISGERAYHRARRGEVFEMKAREVEIKSFKILESEREYSVFEIRCSKGTYVRSLARDIGRSLGCFGYIGELRRLAAEPFGEESCVSISTLESFFKSEKASTEQGVYAPPFFLKPEIGLQTLHELLISKEEAIKVKCGAAIPVFKTKTIVNTKKAYAMVNGSLVAIGEICSGMFKPERVLDALLPL